MLNGRQRQIKAAPGSPLVTVRSGQRQEPYAQSGPGPNIRDRTAWLDFISVIADNALPSGPPPLPDYLIPRCISMAHSRPMQEPWCYDIEYALLMDAESGL